MASEVLRRVIKLIPGSDLLARIYMRPHLPLGPEGIRKVGHRAYVGGLWDEIGKLQFAFLVKEGLEPHHYLLDIACGSLRGGIHFIAYLEPGHYLGIDKEKDLLDAGLENELDREVYERKKPNLVVSDSFEFDKFSARPHFALAQSLFTHLPPRLIEGCFKKLRQFIRDDGVFYATFFEAEHRVLNPRKRHYNIGFFYTRQQVERFANENGFKPEYIGDWDHPRGQKMVRYRPA